MLTDRAEGLMRLSRVTKYILVSAGCLVTSCMTVHSGDPASALQAAVLPASIMLLAHLACGPSWHSWARTHFSHPVQTAVWVTSADSLISALSLLAVRTWIPDAAAIPMGPFLLIAATALLASNRFLPAVLSKLIFGRRRQPRILVLGPEDSAAILHRQIHVARAVGLEIVQGHNISEDQNRGLRLFDPDNSPEPDTAEQRTPIHSRIYHPDSPHAVDRVIFVRQDDDYETLERQQEIQRCCDAAGLPLTVYTNVRSTSHQSVTSNPVSCPGVPRVRHEPLQNPINLTIKRILDVAISLPFVVFVLPPLCVVVRMAHRSQSPGPLFYRQTRCGKNGTTFAILKFRTMHVPEPGQTDIEDNPTPRIFELGSILRDSRLDEIPQFVNVLLGSMSIVGPRAHHIQDREKFSSIVPQYPMRMQAKPGITGPAQYKEYRGVFPRNSVDSRVACDLDYIDHWSVQTDLILMVKTGRLISDSLFNAGLRRFGRQPAATPALNSSTVEHPVLAPVKNGQAPDRDMDQAA